MIFIKKVFRKYSWYKNLRIQYRNFLYNLNNLLWKQITPIHLKFNPVYKKTEYLFKGLKLNFDEKKINCLMKDLNLKAHKEYIYEIERKCFLEPNFGWAIIKPNNLLVESLPNSTLSERFLFDDRFLLKDDKIRKELMPSLFIFYKNCLLERNIINLKKAISFRDVSEASYFHFFSDILTKLFLLKNNESYKDYPIIVSKKLLEKEFFNFILGKKLFKDHTILVQENNFISVNKLIFCKSMPFRKENYLYFLNLLNTPKPIKNTKRRVFINRSMEAGRYIINFDEIKPVLEKHGFEIVINEKLSFEEQIQLFSTVRNIIGLHGAGLTNIIFRKGFDLSLLEIFPPYMLPPHYYWLSKAFGYNYDAISGETSSIQDMSYYKEPYYIDVVKLEKKISKLEKEGFFI